MKKNNGAILLIILVFVQIFSLMSLYALASVTSLFKYSRKHWQDSQNHYQALAILAQIEDFNREHLADCIIPVTPVQEIKQFSPGWWQENGCYGRQNLFSYSYVLELLGEDSCSLIKVQDKEVFAAFYRISLIVFFSDANEILLQSTIAIPQNSSSDCKTESHVISSGRQMLRFIR